MQLLTLISSGRCWPAIILHLISLFQGIRPPFAVLPTTIPIMLQMPMTLYKRRSCRPMKNSTKSQARTVRGLAERHRSECVPDAVALQEAGSPFA